MTKKVSAAQAKAHFSSLIAEAAYGHQRIVIERRGKPLAALVSLDDLERLEQGRAASSQPGGALALVGAWKLLEDSQMDSLTQDIYAEREKDVGRPVEFDV